MKRISMFVCGMLCITMLSQAQIDFQLRKAENDEVVDLTALLKGKDGNFKPTFLITWSHVFCIPCMDVIESMGNAAKSGLAQVLAVNIDKDWSTAKSYNYHTTRWSNATNLYVDNELNNSFGNYFTQVNAPLIVFFNESGHIQYMDVSYTLRSYMFTDYFGKEFIWQDQEGLNSYAWNYYLEHSTEDKIIPETDAEMAKALEFIQRSVSLDANYNNTDTYAALLFLSGKYNDALKKAKEAIDIAKTNNEDYETTSELIQKIIEKM